MIEQDVLDYIKEHGLPERPNKYETFMGFARMLEKQSSCLRNKFGTIIITPDFTKVLSIGYNGQYKNGPNHCQSLSPGKCRCIHSEINALIKYPYGECNDAIMLITGNPCYSCATCIINAGIKTIVYDREYISDNFEGLNLLKSVNLDIKKLSEIIAVK